MNIRQTRTLEAFKRALDFTTALPDRLGTAKASIVPLRGELAGVVARLQAHAAAQDLGARQRDGGTDYVDAQIAAMRRTLMQPIADLARQLIASTPGGTNPGLRRALSMPPVRRSVTAMLTAATAMADAAEPHVQLFVDKGGLEPDFVQRLRDAARQVAQAVDDRARERARVAGATAGLQADVRRGRHAVKLLDTLISAELADDPVRLRMWKTSKRVVGLAGGSGGNSVSAPGGGAGTQTPAAA